MKKIFLTLLLAGFIVIIFIGIDVNVVKAEDNWACDWACNWSKTGADSGSYCSPYNDNDSWDNDVCDIQCEDCSNLDGCSDGTCNSSPPSDNPLDDDPPPPLNNWACDWWIDGSWGGNYCNPDNNSGDDEGIIDECVDCGDLGCSDGTCNSSPTDDDPPPSLNNWVCDWDCYSDSGSYCISYNDSWEAEGCYNQCEDCGDFGCSDGTCNSDDDQSDDGTSDDGTSDDGTSDDGTSPFLDGLQNPLKVNSFEELIENIINFIFLASLVIAPIIFVFAGFNLITSAGDVAKVSSAKNMMLYTAIGLTVILLSRALVAVIRNAIGG